MKKNPVRTWILEDHVCRHCGGRILRCATNQGMTPGGNPLYTCADCGATTSSMGPRGLCWCGYSHRGQQDGSYMCLPFSILETKPYLRNAFAACGSNPDRGAQVGILTVDSYRRAEEQAQANGGVLQTPEEVAKDFLLTFKGPGKDLLETRLAGLVEAVRKGRV